MSVGVRIHNTTNDRQRRRGARRMNAIITDSCLKIEIEDNKLQNTNLYINNHNPDHRPITDLNSRANSYQNEHDNDFS